MYHYKAPHDGCTRHSVNGLKYIDKLGKLISIEAYTVATTVMYVDPTAGRLAGVAERFNPMLRIIVRGENGTCTYGGFLWGYGGEGPHGLRDMFIKCGMTKEIADHYAFTGTLGPNDATEKNTKLYNAKTLWKFLNSDIGWNRINIEKQVSNDPNKLTPGQMIQWSFAGSTPRRARFVEYCVDKERAIVDDGHKWEIFTRSITHIKG